MSHFDPRDRELCVDGACIGLIGPDGHCKECGTPGASAKLDPRRRGLRDEQDIMDELEEHIIKSDLMAAPEGFEDRLLCPDGTCIGVIGANGRCQECGATAEKPAAKVKRARGTADSGADEYDDDNRDDPAGDENGDDDPAEFDERQLCPDGACIGVIGRDGRCKECGLTR